MSFHYLINFWLLSKKQVLTSELQSLNAEVDRKPGPDPSEKTIEIQYLGIYCIGKCNACHCYCHGSHWNPHSLRRYISG